LRKWGTYVLWRYGIAFLRDDIGSDGEMAGHRRNEMSAYQIEKMLHDLAVTPGLVPRFWAEPEAVMGEYGLTAAEAAMVREQDLGGLGRYGVNPVLLMGLRVLGQAKGPGGGPA